MKQVLLMLGFVWLVIAAMSSCPSRSRRHRLRLGRQWKWRAWHRLGTAVQPVDAYGRDRLQQRRDRHRCRRRP